MLTEVWWRYGQPVAYHGRVVWFVLVLAALLWGVLRPEGPHEPFPFYAVGLHVLAFVALGLSARFAFNSLPGGWVWLVVLAAAVALELLQTQIQPHTRHFSLLDIGGNVAGVLIAMGVWPWARKWLQR